MGEMVTPLDAVSNPHRRRILRLVWTAELTSGEIASHFDITWPAISQNLKVLKEAGLVRERREGTQRLYRAHRRNLRPLEAVLRDMWKRDLSRLGRLAEAEERRRN